MPRMLPDKRAFAREATTARSGSSRREGFAPIFALMDGLWTRAIRSTVAGGDTRSRARQGRISVDLTPTAAA